MLDRFVSEMQLNFGAARPKGPRIAKLPRMPSHREHRHLPYSREQMFDLVADVEKYPEFIDWFVAIRVLRRDGNALDVEQVVRFKGLRARFVTHALLERPGRIAIATQDPPFKNFEQQWTFSPAGAHATALDYRSSLELRSPLLQHTLQMLLDEPEIARKTVDAFQRRAQQIYASPHS